jgi:hypothetical protein
VKEPGALLKANGFVPADYGRFLRSERRPIIKKSGKQSPGAQKYTKHSSHAFAPKRDVRIPESGNQPRGA